MPPWEQLADTLAIHSAPEDPEEAHNFVQAKPTSVEASRLNLRPPTKPTEATACPGPLAMPLKVSQAREGPSLTHQMSGEVDWEALAMEVAMP